MSSFAVCTQAASGADRFLSQLQDADQRILQTAGYSQFCSLRHFTLIFCAREPRYMTSIRRTRSSSPLRMRLKI